MQKDVPLPSLLSLQTVIPLKEKLPSASCHWFVSEKSPKYLNFPLYCHFTEKNVLIFKRHQEMFSNCSKRTDSVSQLVSVLVCVCPHLWL